MNTEPSDLDLAAFELEAAKEQETEARERRLKCEQDIIHLVGLKDEGTTTAKTHWYKVSVTQSIDRKLTDDYYMCLEGIPNEIQHEVIKLKPALDVRAYKALAASHPDLFRQLQAGVIAKPGKPAVKLERLAPEQEAA